MPPNVEENREATSGNSAVTDGFLMVAFSIIVGVGAILGTLPSMQWRPEEESSAPYGNDFLQEWVGGHLILEGHANRLYDPKFFEVAQHDPARIGFRWSTSTYFPPVYPPPHYLLATMVAWIPYRHAVLGWMAILTLALIAGWWLQVRFLRGSNSPQTDSASDGGSWLRRWSWGGLLLFPATFSSLVMAQKGALWWLLIALGWVLLMKRYRFAAGLTLGLLSVKPTLFFLLPFLVMRHREWRCLLGMTCSVTLLWGVSLLVLPWQTWTGFFHQLAMTGHYASIPGYHLDWSCNLMSLAYAMPSGIIPWVKFFVVLPLSLGAVWVLLGPRFGSLVHPTPMWHWMVVTFLLSPHAYYYDLMVMLIPIYWCGQTMPGRALVAYVMLALSSVVAPKFLEWTGLPLIPIVLIAFIAEAGLTHQRLFVLNDLPWLSRAGFFGRMLHRLKVEST